MPVYTIGSDYGYVILAGSATVFLNLWQMFRIGKLRKAYGIKYPQMTSDQHPDFNCAQRVHQNTLESIPFILAMLLMGGLRHPQYAAGFGAAWLFGRVVYSIGYYTGKPEKRIPGAIISTLLGLFPLTGLAISSGAGLLGLW